MCEKSHFRDQEIVGFVDSRNACYLKSYLRKMKRRGDKVFAADSSQRKMGAYLKERTLIVDPVVEPPVVRFMLPVFISIWSPG